MQGYTTYDFVKELILFEDTLMNLSSAEKNFINVIPFFFRNGYAFRTEESITLKNPRVIILIYWQNVTHRYHKQTWKENMKFQWQKLKRQISNHKEKNWKEILKFQWQKLKRKSLITIKKLKWKSQISKRKTEKTLITVTNQSTLLSIIVHIFIHYG